MFSPVWFEVDSDTTHRGWEYVTEYCMGMQGDVPWTWGRRMRAKVRIQG